MRKSMDWRLRRTKHTVLHGRVAGMNTWSWKASSYLKVYFHAGLWVRHRYPSTSIRGCSLPVFAVYVFSAELELCLPVTQALYHFYMWENWGSERQIISPRVPRKTGMGIPTGAPWPQDPTFTHTYRACGYFVKDKSRATQWTQNISFLSGQ